jgi:hypothetical protein
MRLLVPTTAAQRFRQTALHADAWNAFFVDALFVEAQASPGDFDTRVELQREIDDIVLNQDPMGVPLQALGFHGASRENVGGW